LNGEGFLVLRDGSGGAGEGQGDQAAPDGDGRSRPAGCVQAVEQVGRAGDDRDEHRETQRAADLLGGAGQARGDALFVAADAASGGGEQGDERDAAEQPPDDAAWQQGPEAASAVVPVTMAAMPAPVPMVETARVVRVPSVRSVPGQV
jgi:hypothetical protein